jgi:hypothetical protein
MMMVAAMQIAFMKVWAHRSASGDAAPTVESADHALDAVAPRTHYVVLYTGEVAVTVLLSHNIPKSRLVATLVSS